MLRQREEWRRRDLHDAMGATTNPTGGGGGSGNVSLLLALIASLVILAVQVLLSGPAHGNAEPRAATPTAAAAVRPRSRNAPPSIAAVLPCTVHDVDWLHAKLLSCARTLDARSVRLVLVVLPPPDVAPVQGKLRRAGVQIPPHWVFVGEDEVVPDLWRNGTRVEVPGWNLQQAIKLLAHRHPLIARAEPPMRALLTLDSDVLCSHAWARSAEQPPRGRVAVGAESARSLEDAFVLADGRLRTCIEHLSGWFGARHLSRTAHTFGYSLWVRASSATRPFQITHAMGWTPQLMSLPALARVEAELHRQAARIGLLERSASLSAARPAAVRAAPPLPGTRREDEIGPRAPDSWPAQTHALYALLASNDMWTEYFSYFLALDALGAWGAYHSDLCPGSKLEPATGRCRDALNATRWQERAGLIGLAEGSAPVSALPRGAALPAPSAGVSGCLKVRADCDLEVLLELERAIVPFVTVNDHKVKGRRALELARAHVAEVEGQEAAAARAERGATRPQPRAYQSGRAHARACCEACTPVVQLADAPSAEAGSRSVDAPGAAAAAAAAAAADRTGAACKWTKVSCGPDSRFGMFTVQPESVRPGWAAAATARAFVPRALGVGILVLFGASVALGAALSCARARSAAARPEPPLGSLFGGGSSGAHGHAGGGGGALLPFESRRGSCVRPRGRTMTAEFAELLAGVNELTAAESAAAAAASQAATVSSVSESSAEGLVR